MNLFSFAVKGLTRPLRTTIPLLLLAALTAATVTGALLAGDSVRETLSAIARERLGGARLILDSPARFLSDGLVDRLAALRPDWAIAPVVLAVGTARAGDLQLSGVQVVGVDDAFFSLAPGGGQDPSAGSRKAPGRGEAFLNERAASALSLQSGGELLVSVPKSGGMPLDSPLSGSNPGTAAIAVTMKTVLGVEDWGRFSLRAEQRAPATIFVNRAELAGAIGKEGRVNLVLAGPRKRPADRARTGSVDGPAAAQELQGAGGSPPAAGRGAASARDPASFNQDLAAAWDIRDAGFSIRRVGRFLSFESERVFIEPEAATIMDGPAAGGLPVSGYFLDSVSFGASGSPFAFAAGVGPRLFSEAVLGRAAEAPTEGAGLGTQRSGAVPGDRAGAEAPDNRSAESPRAGELVISDWLAEDLGARPGDIVTLDFRVPIGGKLERRWSEMKVLAVVALPGSQEARSLMPDFPGMAAAESCAAWDPGIPLDLSKLRPKDEQYWNGHRGTPKVFLSTDEAARLWGSAYGARTAYLFPGDDPENLARRLSSAVGPDVLGVRFKDAAAFGAQARGGPLDFGALFLGLSLFLIASSLILTGLVFSLHVSSKERETGLLLAVGLPRGKVIAVRLFEGLIVGAVACGLGCLAGIAYSLLVVSALNGPWSGAVAGGGIRHAVRPESLCLSFASSLLVSLAVMALSLGRGFARSAMGLLTGGPGAAGAGPRRGGRRGAAGAGSPKGARRGAAIRFSAGVLLACMAFLFAAFPSFMGGRIMGFFMAGAAALLALFALQAGALKLIDAGVAAGSPFTLGLRGAASRRRRTLASSLIVACGLFVVASVGANPWLARPETRGKTSGSGGFEYFLRTSGPFMPADAASRLDQGFSIVAAKLKEGDDASCLNLAASVTPPVIGVDPALLRGRFRFDSMDAGANPSDAWGLLDALRPDGSINAFADSLSLEWNLGLKVGDTLTLEDESGRPLPLKIAGALSPSLFQGYVLISEDAFRSRFPSVSGYSIALIERKGDARAGRAASGTAGGAGDARAGGAGAGGPDVDPGIARVFRGYGAMIERAEARLESFARVEYAYLEIFLFLGAAGLLFGMAGYAVLARKGIREESGRHALLGALGFGRPALFMVSVVEQTVSLAAGLLSGVVSSAIALAPLAEAGGFPAGTLFLMTACAAAAGLTWTAIASIHPGTLKSPRLSEELD